MKYKIVILDARGKVLFEQFFGDRYLDSADRREKTLTARILIDKFEDWVITTFCGARAVAEAWLKADGGV